MDIMKNLVKNTNLNMNDKHHNVLAATPIKVEAKAPMTQDLGCTVGVFGDKMI